MRYEASRGPCAVSYVGVSPLVLVKSRTTLWHIHHITKVSIIHTKPLPTQAFSCHNGNTSRTELRSHQRYSAGKSEEQRQG